MKLTIRQVCDAMGASAACDLSGPLGDGVLCCAIHDSRAAGPGDLFVCIRGERVDGHAYADKAVAGGAAAVLAESGADLPGVADGLLAGSPVLTVNDTVAALGRLGRFWREQTTARVAGITGTAGKTTAKEMLATVLGTVGRVAKNPMNLNSQVGLPESILSTDGDEDFWVMEAGISQARDMDELGPILAPDVALVLNVGPGHTEGLGTVGDVARHKARLAAHLRSGGAAVASLDYPELVRSMDDIFPGWSGFSAKGASGDPRCEAAVAYLGPEIAGSDVMEAVPDAATAQYGRFALAARGEDRELVLPLRGQAAAENVAAVTATALALGVGLDAICAGLALPCGTAHRFEVHRTGDLLVIDDAYNANPLSMRRSLARAAECAKEGQGPGCSLRPLALVLGEMRELGDLAASAHEELGRHVAALAPAVVFWAGAHGEDVARGLAAGGWQGEFAEAGDAETFVGRWKALGPERAVVLFKGSRGNGLDVHARALLKEMKHAV